MRVGIIVGCEYRGEGLYPEFLPGISIDVNIACNHMKKFNPEKILIITDFNVKIDNVCCHKYINKNDMMTKIKDSLVVETDEVNQIASQVFFYYTGHAENGNIILPSLRTKGMYETAFNFDAPYLKGELLASSTTQEFIDLINIRDIILDNVSSDCEILFVFDCCDGVDLKLDQCSERNPPNRNIKCISSSRMDEKSVTTRNGSLFTKSFFESIRNNKTFL